MHQCHERDREEDRKPGGKTRVKEISVGLKGDDVLDRTKWKNYIQYHSDDCPHDGNSRRRRRRRSSESGHLKSDETCSRFLVISGKSNKALNIHAEQQQLTMFLQNKFSNTVYGCDFPCQLVLNIHKNVN